MQAAKLAAAGALALALAGGGGQAFAHQSHATAAKPSIQLLSAGASTNRHIVVEVKVSHFTLYPTLVGGKPKAGGGHWHIFVDGKYNAYSTDPATGVSSRVAPGKHTVFVTLNQNNHADLNPPVKSKTMTVVVK